MVGAHLAQHRRLAAAPVCGVGAAARKFAARLRVDGAGHVAGKHLRPFLGLFVRVRNGHAGKQCLAIGVQGMGIDVVAGGQLYQVAQIHDGNAV